jgi:hypothetical protein
MTFCAHQKGLMAVLPLVLGSGLVIAVLAVACGTPDPNATIDPVGPDRATFKPVALTLARRCGSLECHGSPYRNFRIYGYGGARLDPNDRPDTPMTVTAQESDADYDAVIAIEPEIMRDVVAAKGDGYERLTFVRKGRGAEAHKGGQPIVPGDDADRCVHSWLAGSIEVAACNRAGCVGDGGIVTGACDHP